MKEYMQKWHQGHPGYQKEYRRKWREAHPDLYRERLRVQAEYNKKWRQANPERNRKMQQKYSKTHQKRRNERAQKYARRHPEKIKAKNIAERLPLSPCCIFCGSTEKLERHHPDYDSPEFFITLCQNCHNEVTLNN